jgi:hypothetical protein
MEEKDEEKINNWRMEIQNIFTLISGFHRDVDKICALLGCYAASCGNRLLGLLAREDVTDTLS